MGRIALHWQILIALIAGAVAGFALGKEYIDNVTLEIYFRDGFCLCQQEIKNHPKNDRFETGRGAMADILGYARVSTHTQDLEAQRRRLQEEGALRVFEDVVSGRTFDRPGLGAQPLSRCG